MRVLAIFLLVGFFADAWASSHEAAAREFYLLWTKVDKARMVDAMASATGSRDPHSQTMALVAMESPEWESIHVKHLLSTFSEQELRSLIEMAKSSAFRLYSERMGQFSERVLPEVAAYFRANALALSQKANERQKERWASCRAEGPLQLPGQVNNPLFATLERAEKQGYSCNEVLADKLAKALYVSCTNEKTSCDDRAVISFKVDQTTLTLENINIGRPSAVIDALTKQGRLTPGTLPRK